MLATAASDVQCENAEPSDSLGRYHDIAHGGVASDLDGPCDEMRTVDKSLEPEDIGRVFPREIVDIIIDQLGQPESLDVLRQCCLVCWAWVPRVRHHLFRRVAIRIKKRRNDRGSPQDALLEFSAFLAQAPPSVTRSIRALKISGGRPIAAVSLTSIRNVAVRLPSLHTLHISSVQLVGRIEHQDTVHSFTTLRLDTFVMVERFLDLLLIVSNPIALEIPSYAVGIGNVAENVSAYAKQSPPVCIRLRSLTLMTECMNSLFAGLLLPMLSENMLTSLSLRCVVTDGQVNTEDVGKLIRHARLTLERLSLNLGFTRDDEGTHGTVTQEAARTGLNLDLCTSLVSIDLDLSSTSTFILLFVRTLFRELFSRRPGHAETLRFIVVRADSLDDITGLDQTLHLYMPPGSSTRVRLAWRIRESARHIKPEDRDAFVEAMPLLHGRGRLYFHPDGDSDPSVPWDACVEVGL